jgi:tetratricopeptide (TPR) repeat protein
MEQSVDESELRKAAEGGDPDALIALGDHLLYSSGDLDGAEAAYEQLERTGDIRGALKLGALLEDFRKDQPAAAAAWRRADEAGDINGSGNLGRLLREQGDLRGAEAAFRRCVDRGSERAVADWAAHLFQRDDAAQEEVAEAIALLCKAHDRFIWGGDDAATEVFAHVMLLDGLNESCEPAAIEAGTRRADEEGSASGAWHLAWLLKEQGRLPEAVVAFRRAAERKHEDAWMRGAGTYMEMGDMAAAEAMAREGDQAGAASAAGFLGALLDERGDRDGAFEAYKRADSRGDGNGAFNLGISLVERRDFEGAEQALGRAKERGIEKAEAAIEQVRQMRFG